MKGIIIIIIVLRGRVFLSSLVWTVCWEEKLDGTPFSFFLWLDFFNWILFGDWIYIFAFAFCSSYFFCLKHIQFFWKRIEIFAFCLPVFSLEAVFFLSTLCFT
jgi:hypothetical protein